MKQGKKYRLDGKNWIATWAGRAIIIGEKAVRKPMGKHSWSKQLSKAAYNHQDWKRRYKMHQYGVEEDEVMEELRLTAGILPICR